MEKTPGQAAGAERLHEYWVHGEGAGKIRWGTHGDFERCVEHLGKYVSEPKGVCNLMHHDATGMWPAQHAKLERESRGQKMRRALTKGK